MRTLIDITSRLPEVVSRAKYVVGRCRRRRLRGKLTALISQGEYVPHSVLAGPGVPEETRHSWVATYDGLIYPGAPSLSLMAGALGLPGVLLAIANAKPQEAIAA
ncbi:MAG: hypothetical protein ABI206_04755, partial [Antricoccus sp.]